MGETMSASIAALAAALAKAQGQMTHASKDATNPHFKTRYADLAAVWSAIREPLAANGLSVIQQVTQAEGMVGVRSILAHASGEWVSSDLQMPVAQKTPQGYGSALTYARRYSLAALVGIAQDDDDGEAGTRPSAPVLPPVQRRQPMREQPAPTPAPQPAAPVSAEPDPMERALLAIAECGTSEDLQAATRIIKQLGVTAVPEVRKAFASRQKELRGQP
jgi:hypothetical protein